MSGLDPQRWRKGDKISARTLNQTVDRVIDLAGGAAAPADAKGAGAAGLIQQFEVKSVEADYLTCRTVTSAGVGTVDVLVAKPYLLRNAIVSRNGITYSYASTQERTATKSPDTETQVVVPVYVAGDRIFAARAVGGATGVKDGTRPVRWLDMNIDARAWAKKQGT